MGSTLTSRLKLFKPVPTSGENFRASDFNANMDKLDLGGNGFFICTSTTRPATPFANQQIYETDTTNKYIWDGDSWEPLGVIKCTSGTRPASPSAGWEIYETDTKASGLWNGTAWEGVWVNWAAADFKVFYLAANTGYIGWGPSDVSARYKIVNQICRFEWYFKIQNGAVGPNGSGAITIQMPFDVVAAAGVTPADAAGTWPLGQARVIGSNGVQNLGIVRKTNGVTSTKDCVVCNVDNGAFSPQWGVNMSVMGWTEFAMA